MAAKICETFPIMRDKKNHESPPPGGGAFVAQCGNALDFELLGKGFNPLFGQLLLVRFANLCQELFKVAGRFTACLKTKRTSVWAIDPAPQIA
jgi:hypothetical protein